MYALAVMMSRSDDAVQIYHQCQAGEKLKNGIPCVRSLKSSCQSCREVGKGDHTDVGSTCPSPTRQRIQMIQVRNSQEPTSASVLPLSLNFSRFSSTIGLSHFLKKAQSPFVGNTPDFFPFFPLFPPFF